MTGEHPHPARLSLLADLGHQPRLAHARLSGSQRQPAVPGQRVVYQPAQAGPLGVPLHQRRERGHSNAAGAR